MDYVPNEERPHWYFKLHTYLFHSIYISYINIFGEQAIDELRAIREGLGLGMFDNFEHAVNSFPSISLAGISFVFCRAGSASAWGQGGIEVISIKVLVSVKFVINQPQLKT